MRLTQYTLTAVLAVGFASCSGGGTPLSPAMPQYPNAQQPVSGQSATPLSGTMHPNTNPNYLTVNGTIVRLLSGGFTLSTSACSADVHIDLESYTTISGGKIALNEPAKVYGQGSCTAIAAHTITIGSSSGSSDTSGVPTHLLTADYLGKPYGTTAISWSSAAPYLSWAQVDYTVANAVHDAGIKTEYYVDPNVTTSGDALYTSNAATFAYTCGGSRVSYAYDGHVMDIMAIGGSAMQSLFASYTASIASAAHFDAVFEDNAGPINTPTLPCGYSDSEWITYGKELNQVSHIPVLFGGLEVLHDHTLSLSAGLLASSNTIGGNYEHCYSDSGTPEYTGWPWTGTETTELYVNNYGKIFKCQARNPNAASSSYAARIYTLASFLLTYNPSRSVLWEEFSTPSGLRVLPETGLVPMSPVITPSSIASLKTSGGTYARQYQKCYLRGSLVGACAVVVNSDYVAHPFPYTAYHHTLELSGSGVLDGGKVYTTGGPPPSTLASGQASIVFP
jgi:hypothetical protein